MKKLSEQDWRDLNDAAGFFDPIGLVFHDGDLRDRPFELRAALNYITRRGESICVHAGYRTDWASVPRFFHRIISPVGKHGKAAFVHDWLCDPKSGYPFGWWDAAGIFGECMQLLGVNALTRWSMVAAVRIGGPRFKKGSK